VWPSIWRALSLQRKSYPAWWKIAERIILSLLSFAAVAVAANSIFDAVIYFESSPPGAMYLVDGHRMRIDCTGSGSPTIVLDAGHGNDGPIWGGVEPVLARTTRVCSYDRAGFGWSDPLSPPRDADHIANELHGLLMAAHVDGPIVLMGHSIAGLYIRDYAGRFPASVVGLIFVDASTPSQNMAMDPTSIESRQSPRSLGRLLQRGEFTLGLPRLFGACPGSIPGFGHRAALPRLEGLCHEHFEAYTGEWENFDRSSLEALDAGSFGKLPVLIFSRDTTNKVWNQKQESLKKLSTRSRRMIAKGSGHYIQLECPALIEREVTLFIEELRGTAREPTAYGSTTEE
jgi:pimeloyl-ACP methyl ester carboxylesterase